MDKTILIKIVKHLKLYLNSNYIYSLIYIYIYQGKYFKKCMQFYINYSLMINNLL